MRQILFLIYAAVLLVGAGSFIYNVRRAQANRQAGVGPIHIGWDPRNYTETGRRHLYWAIGILLVMLGILHVLQRSMPPA